MIFDLKISELLIISLFFITAINCALTYFCCTKSLKVLDKDKSISKAVNKLRIFDQYVLSKINLLVAFVYFGMCYLFFDDVCNGDRYVFFFACLLSFVLTLVTTFVSRLCYCYTCNVLLDTKLNEFECLVLNFKRLIVVYIPFIIISLFVPSIYMSSFPLYLKNIICIIGLVFILVVWVCLTPMIMIFTYNAKKIEDNTLLKYRLQQLMNAHKIEKYKLYYWDTSRSKESNAMVSGVRTCYIFVSSSLLDEITLPELETVITHEIGHIKNKHMLKLMIGKLFVLASVVLTVLVPFIFNINIVSIILFYVLDIFLVILSVAVSVGIERKYELEADLYAANYNDPELFSSALRKILKYEDVDNKNYIDELFQSHPDVESRIEKIKKSDE